MGSCSPLAWVLPWIWRINVSTLGDGIAVAVISTRTGLDKVEASSFCASAAILGVSAHPLSQFAAGFPSGPNCTLSCGRWQVWQ
jgi:hypothetical protein